VKFTYLLKIRYSIAAVLGRDGSEPTYVPYTYWRPREKALRM